MSGALRLHDGEGHVFIEAEQVVRLLRLAPVGFIVFIDGNHPVRDGVFHMDIVPPAPFVFQHRRNETQLRGFFILIHRLAIFDS